MRHFAAIIFLIWTLFGLASPAVAVQKKLVLVTSAAHLENVSLSQKEVRRLYLGKKLVKGTFRIRALVNNTDPLLYQVFLQKVLFLSDATYQRTLLGSVFRGGVIRPANISNMFKLEELLQLQTGTVTFMWSSTANTLSNVYIIGDLWNGTVD